MAQSFCKITALCLLLNLAGVPVTAKTNAAHKTATQTPCQIAFSKGQKLLVMDSGGCLKYFDEAIRLNPQYTVAYLQAGRFLMGRNKWTEAVKYFDRGLEVDKDFYSMRSSRAYCNACLKNWELALRDYNYLIDKRQADSDDLQNRARVYERIGRLDLARKDRQTIAMMKESDNGNKNANIIIKYLTQSLKTSSDTREIYARRGAYYKQQRNFKNAIADITKVLTMPKGQGGKSINYNLDQLYYDRASCYDQIGDFAHAASDYSKILEIDPDAEEAFLYRGNCFSKLGQWEKAVNDYTLSIKHDHEPTATVYKNRATAYEKIGKSELAKLDSLKAKSLSGKD